MSELPLIVVPDADDDDAALIFVDGAVAGRPSRFLLDTGAGRTCLQLDDLTASFPRVGTASSSGLFGAGASEDVIVVPRLELGPLAKENVRVTRVSRPGAGNLIGMDFLVAHRLLFQFDALRLLIDPPDEPPAAALHPLLLDRTNHSYVDVRFGDVISSAVWDSGAGITVVDLALARRHPAHFREVGRSRGTDSTGATMETPAFVMTGVELGGRGFPPHPVAAVDLSGVNARIERPMDLVLGYSTLSLANWWLDFPGRRWAVTGLVDEV